MFYLLFLPHPNLAQIIRQLLFQSGNVIGKKKKKNRVSRGRTVSVEIEPERINFALDLARCKLFCKMVGKL